MKISRISMNGISNSECEKMIIHPNTEKPLVDVYPQILQITQEAGLPFCEQSDLAMRFISLVYDPYSPLTRKFPDLKSRREQAANAINFTLPKDEKLIAKYQKLTTLYLRHIAKSLQWRYIMARQHLYNEYEECIYDPIKKGDDVKDADIITATQKKALISKEMQLVITELPSLLLAFYGDDNDLITRHVIELTPETIALKVNK